MGMMNNGYGQPPAGDGGGHGYGPDVSRLDYEFTQRENKTIQKAASWAKILAIVIFIQAGLSAIQQLAALNICGVIVGVGVALAVGISFFQAGKSLQAVVDTEGSDIGHMMTALERLGTAFMIRIVLVCVAIGLVVLAVLALVALGAAAFGGSRF